MRQNFISQFIQLLKRWLYNMRLGVAVKNWALSVEQCRLQLSVHLIHLMSILVRCNADHRMVSTEFSGNFSCSCKRISFDDCPQLVPSDGRPPCPYLQGSHRLYKTSWTMTTLHYSWAKCIVSVQIVSVALWPILNLNKKTAQIHFLSNIISLV